MPLFYFKVSIIHSYNCKDDTTRTYNYTIAVHVRTLRKHVHAIYTVEFSKAVIIENFSFSKYHNNVSKVLVVVFYD